MFDIVVEGDFDASACTDCEVGTDCQAYALFDRIVSSVDAEDVIDAYTRTVAALAKKDHQSRNEAFGHNKEAQKQFNSFQRRVQKMSRTAGDIIVKCVEAQSLPSIGDDSPHQRAIHNIARGYRDELQHSGVVLEDLYSAGTDLRFNADRGICAAAYVLELSSNDSTEL